VRVVVVLAAVPLAWSIERATTQNGSARRKIMYRFKAPTRKRPPSAAVRIVLSLGSSETARIVSNGVMNPPENPDDVVRISELPATDPFRHLLGIVGSARSRGFLSRVEIASNAFDEVLHDPGFAAALQQISGERSLAGDPALAMLELVLRTPVTIRS
jgi:hypothetical protein